jgi:hypothetical protein
VKNVETGTAFNNAYKFRHAHYYIIGKRSFWNLTSTNHKISESATTQGWDFTQRDLLHRIAGKSTQFDAADFKFKLW